MHFETVDASSGQLTKASTAADLAKLDLARVNPVTGPVFIDGAKDVCPDVQFISNADLVKWLEAQDPAVLATLLGVTALVAGRSTAG